MTPEERTFQRWAEYYGVECSVEAASALTAALVTRWIPVSERLPEPKINVLCWHQDYRAPHDPARADAWVGSWEECDGVWCFLDGFGTEIRTVTHWQPLPPAPTEAESQDRQKKSRWTLLTRTSPSGKSLFQCKVCKRVSATPDKNCTRINQHVPDCQEYWNAHHKEYPDD